MGIKFWVLCYVYLYVCMQILTVYTYIKYIHIYLHVYMYEGLKDVKSYSSNIPSAILRNTPTWTLKILSPKLAWVAHFFMHAFSTAFFKDTIMELGSVDIMIRYCILRVRYLLFYIWLFLKISINVNDLYKFLPCWNLCCCFAICLLTFLKVVVLS